MRKSGNRQPPGGAEGRTGAGAADYSVWKPGIKEGLKILAEGVLLCLCLDFLFYESVRALLPLSPVVWLYYRWRERRALEERKRRLTDQFRAALSSMAVAVEAGYSLENAVAAARRDLEQLYAGESDMSGELLFMERQLKVSVPAEDLFADLGRRSSVEEIRDFASVLYIARHTGGDLAGILKKTGQMLGDKIETAREIDAVLAAKKSEQQVMSLMPAGIIVYLKLASPGFLSSMYGNPAGAALMTGCLLLYAAAWALGKHIVRIDF